MQIKLLRNPASSFGCELLEGETGEVSDVIAKSLVARGVAVVVETPKKLQGVAESASIAEAKPAKVSAKSKAKD
jgi:NAD-dependent oxidoreductase involved in siderophore biosynthesis